MQWLYIHSKKTNKKKTEEAEERCCRQERRTFNGAVTVDFEVIQRRQNVSRVLVIVVRPGSNGVAADIVVGDTILLNQLSDHTLVFVHLLPWLHRNSPHYIVPEF